MLSQIFFFVIFFTTLCYKGSAKHSSVASVCENIISLPSINIPSALIPLLHSYDHIAGLESLVLNASIHGNLAIIDVDNSSLLLFKNQISLNHMLDTNLSILAITYDPTICAQMQDGGVWLKKVPCYFNENWIFRLEILWKTLTRRNENPSKMQLIMLGRLSIFRFLACRGLNAFMGDADLVYFRSPYDYILNDVDVMFTVDRVHHRNTFWGAYISKTFNRYLFSVNNGVWFFRGERDAVKRFAVEFTVYTWESLKTWDAIYQKYFIQIAINNLAKQPNNRLMMDIWHAENNNGSGNKAGDCCDCHFGNWKYDNKYINISSVTNNVTNDIKVGIFPMIRFASCINDQQYSRETNGLKAMISASLRIIGHSENSTTMAILDNLNNNNNNSAWQCLRWDGNSYPAPVLYIHAAGVNPSGVGFMDKEGWFKSLGVWFI